VVRTGFKRLRHGPTEKRLLPSKRLLRPGLLRHGAHLPGWLGPRHLHNCHLRFKHRGGGILRMVTCLVGLLGQGARGKEFCTGLQETAEGARGREEGRCRRSGPMNQKVTGRLQCLGWTREARARPSSVRRAIGRSMIARRAGRRSQKAPVARLRARRTRRAHRSQHHLAVPEGVVSADL
jgi:hypothetical protein